MKAASTVSNDEPKVSTLSRPDADAVQENHRVAEPQPTSIGGSPVSNVAPVFESVTVPDDPVRAVDATK